MNNLFIKYYFLFCIYQLSFIPLTAQPFTHADTLRGSNGPGRDWWDVLKYDLNVKFNIADSTISGSNTITFKVLKKGKMMQIDLQEPLILDGFTILDSVFSKEGDFIGWKKMSPVDIKGIIKKYGNTYFISSGHLLNKYSSEITIYFHGKPKTAARPPWDGGVVWKKDKNNNPWVSIACQGTGASIWYPCKDYQGDEPDSAEMHITCPDSLICVGMGELRNKINNGDGTSTYDWFVKSPINNYSIIPYIGKYVHFGETYKGEKGNLKMDYWVLDSSLEKAKTQFKDAVRMMKAFEYWFGPYPFYEDGYKLVEAPYLGMEHQSAIAYGNGFQNGYAGRDLSNSGWGLKWDFIIVHESGHEWFGNNITTKDIADMWVHEGFTNYSETLFTEYYYGKAAGNAYVIGTRQNIQNDIPIIGPYGVNKEGSSDMYYKAGNMIHTIRQVINNDEKFRQILRGLNKTFYHKTVTSAQIESYINEKSKINFSKVFGQYLRTVKIPVLEYKIENNTVSYRWTNCVAGFNLPVKVSFVPLVGDQTAAKTEQWLKPGTSWNKITLGNWYDKKSFFVNENFYVEAKKVE